MRRIDEQKLRELTMITSYVRYVVRNDYGYRAVTLGGYIDAPSYKQMKQAILELKQEMEARENSN